jgi:hypothetical protein
MKAHELARQLLKLPDFEVLICGDDTLYFDEGGMFSADIGSVAANEMHNEDGTVEMVVIIDLLEE